MESQGAACRQGNVRLRTGRGIWGERAQAQYCGSSVSFGGRQVLQLLVRHTMRSASIQNRPLLLHTARLPSVLLQEA